MPCVLLCLASFTKNNHLQNCLCWESVRSFYCWIVSCYECSTFCSSIRLDYFSFGLCIKLLWNSVHVYVDRGSHFSWVGNKKWDGCFCCPKILIKVVHSQILTWKHMLWYLLFKGKKSEGLGKWARGWEQRQFGNIKYMGAFFLTRRNILMF